MHGSCIGRMAIRQGVRVLMATVTLSGVLAAQEPVNSGTVLELADVVRATLAANSDILLAIQETHGSRGEHLAAGAPFDPFMQADVGAARLRALDPVDTTVAQISQRFGFRRLLRNGLLVGSDMELTRRDLSRVAGVDTPNDLTSSVTLTTPLLRDRGGVESRAPERAAAHEYDASVWGQRQAVAVRVLTAVVAYWDYLEARLRLDVLLRAERLASESAEQTRALVAADERTAADLTQMHGNLASKRATRIAAEQNVVDAWQPLGLAMGLSPEAIIVRPAPSTAFPELPADPTARRPLATLLDEAYGRRPDLTAATALVRAAEARDAGARSALAPRLDLVLGTGYRARAFGLGFSQYFEPLRAESPKHLDASVRFVYEFPTANSAARGHALQRTAEIARAEIVVSDLRRRIAVGVTVAAEALARGEAGMQASDEAVRLLERSVLAEQRKFQVGMSTLFDVIQAQDALTNALLGRIASQHNYAVALVTLRYQTGTLLEERGQTVTIPPSALVTPPP